MWEGDVTLHVNCGGQFVRKVCKPILGPPVHLPCVIAIVALTK